MFLSNSKIKVNKGKRDANLYLSHFYRPLFSHEKIIFAVKYYGKRSKKGSKKLTYIV